MTTQELDAEQKAFIEWYESASDEEQLVATKIVDSLILEERQEFSKPARGDLAP